MKYPLIFLDIDGVLNTHGPIDPEVLCAGIHPDKINRLNFVLRKTDARIVLSSAWRYLVHNGCMTVKGVDWLLRSHGLIGERLIDITRKDTMIFDPKAEKPVPMDNERGAQIRDWLHNNRHQAPYAVIDDLGISQAGHPFVMTDGAVGLTSRDAKQAINLLFGISYL